jgi:hypothetical protein
MTDKLDSILEGLTKAELKTLRAKINGKIGKRTLSPEAQAKMQAGRKKKHRET